MKKSIVINKNIKKREYHFKKHLTFKSPGKGLDPYLIHKFVGKKLIVI